MTIKTKLTPLSLEGITFEEMKYNSPYKRVDSGLFFEGFYIRTRGEKLIAFLGNTILTWSKDLLTDKMRFVPLAKATVTFTRD